MGNFRLRLDLELKEVLISLFDIQKLKNRVNKHKIINFHSYHH